MRTINLGDNLGLTSPDQCIAPGASPDLCKRSSPGARSDHSETIESHGQQLLRVRYLFLLVTEPHAFAPRRPMPIAGTAFSSSGQRARAAKSKPFTQPRASRSAPAQAMMAPLSVHSAGGGT